MNTDGNLGDEDSFTENFNHTMVISFVSVVMDFRVSGGCKLQRTDPYNTPRQGSA
ncbi:MAG: hypothetical protein HOH58_18095 [Opitutaceae bacterium]|nr:hypothetical protein [Opitutaceae bacterium]